MADPGIIEWITIQLKAGYSTKEIYEALVKQGHKPDDVVAAFNAARAQVQPVQETKKLPAAVGIALGLMLFVFAIGFLWPGGPHGAAVVEDQPVIEPEPAPPQAPATQTAPQEQTPTTNQVQTPPPPKPKPVQATTTKPKTEVKPATPKLSFTGFVCNDLPCFYDKFEYCTEATVIHTETISTVREYEIIRLAEDGCRVRTTIIEDHDPKLIGKQMTCTYDNSKDFRFATRDAHVTYDACSGELADIYREGLVEKQYLDCGTSEDCFYNQKKKCEPARAYIDGQTLFIEGKVDGECVVRTH